MSPNSTLMNGKRVHFVRAVRDLRPLIRRRAQGRAGGRARARERGDGLQRMDENEPIGRPGQPATTRGVAAMAKLEGRSTEDGEREI